MDAILSHRKIRLHGIIETKTWSSLSTFIATMRILWMLFFFSLCRLILLSLNFVTIVTLNREEITLEAD